MSYNKLYAPVSNRERINQSEKRTQIGTVSYWLIIFDILVNLIVKQHYFRTRDGGGGRGRFEIVP